MDLALLWTIQAAPLLAFLVIQLLPGGLKKAAPLVAVGGALAAALSSLRLLWLHLDGGSLPAVFAVNWLDVADAPLWAHTQIPHYSLSVGFLVDPLNLLMITLVTVIALFVHVFSAYYMADDASRARYFGFLSFFAFSMTGLVLSSNLLQTFLFWELVGLTSYLLIGFWYEKKSAGDAARKAFVLNRLGDLGFYLGTILLFILFGSLDFVDLRADVLRQAFAPAVLTTLGLLVFTGVMGKSAQFPFHAWLPDAMEGPTPVSALIHSATMVAAGVFLLARGWGLFSASVTTLQVILVIGSLTAFVGASLATVQRDIKKIMAYSTVSQLGFMVMAMGAGAPVAGMFHLSTHACFKSLLFLTAGAFIHHFHTNDIWEIARGGGKKDKLAMAVLTLGLLSLCAVPPFSGFFSKDMILEALKEHSLFFYGVGLFVSFLTNYYSFRMLFVLLFSKEAAGRAAAKPHAPAAHGHDAHAHVAHGASDAAHAETGLLKFCRALPLVSLALLSLYVGALGTPLFHNALLHWLGGAEIESHLDLSIVAVTMTLFAAGVALAWFQFRDPEAAEKRLESSANPVKLLLDRKFFVDDAYVFLVKGVGLRLAALLNWIDKKAFNGILVDRTSYAILGLGKLGSKLQSGQLQDYLSLAMAVGVLILFFVINSGGVHLAVGG
ncbi:MAG TPA: NADH-quinone oxidoreductase subunit L [Candidatus Eisenbacteria bacterium]|nr:NADH-quinone oxidoreductase subunit L [Candidatus Eisenbacteria bacterium]